MSPKPLLRLPVKPTITTRPASSPTKKVLTRVLPKPRLSPPRTLPSSPSTRPSSPSPQWPRDLARPSSARYIVWSANVILSLCAFVWIRDHYFEIQSVSGSSMAPTLNPFADETGRVDWVLMRPYLDHSSRRTIDKDTVEGNKWGLKRGDVVMFWKPHKPEEIGIKRVVAMEGDVVYPARGFALNPKLYEARFQGLPDGHIDNETDGLIEKGLSKLTVPHGHVWVEGDNWRKSLDSNDFGPISTGLILGKAVWVWRSWFRVQRVGDERMKKEMRMRSRIVEGPSRIPAIFLE